MNFAILFPFYRSMDSPFVGPLLSTPLLLGGLRKYLPDESFDQIDINLELRKKRGGSGSVILY